MKKSKIFLAVIAFSCIAVAARAQTADEIVNKHVTAMGGLDNWKKISSFVLSGNLNMGGAELPITVSLLDKKGYRMEFSMNGMANYMIVTPTAGWMYFPIQGQTKPEAVTDDMVKEEQSELDVCMDPLIFYKEKGNTITYLGKDQADGTECHKIKVVDKGGKEQTLFIDASSYYCLKTVEKTKANGKEDESVTNFGNFQKLPEGVVFPMSIEGDGMPITVKNVEINKKIDENIFKPDTKK